MADELQGSARWSIEAGQRITVEREYVRPWAGHATWVASQIGTIDPLIPWCRCRQARVEPLGPISAQPATYTHAKITLVFVAENQSSTPDWPTNNAPTFPANAQVQVQVRGGGDFMLYPARDMRWSDNATANPAQPIPSEDSNVGRIIVPTQDWTITVSNLISVNLPNLREKLGHVNNGAFMGYPSECLLFESFDIDWQWSLDNGQPKVTWSVTWHLKAREIQEGQNSYGWNHEYRGADGWKRVVMANGQDRYPVANFDTLFT